MKTSIESNVKYYAYQSPKTRSITRRENSHLWLIHTAWDRDKGKDGTGTGTGAGTIENIGSVPLSLCSVYRQYIRVI